MPLEAHGATHAGRRRSNEDALLVDGGLGLFVVADGMGGHRAGEVAADLAVRTIQQVVASRPAREAGDLELALAQANEQVLRLASRRSDLTGMGTTVVAALVGRDRLSFISVGDSRLYLLRDGTLTQLTRDDSWVASMLDGGALTAAEVEGHPMRHVLTDVVGARADLQPRAESRDVRPGDVLLLCSDGLHGSVGEEVLKSALGRAEPVAQIAATLVAAALEGGASDNITAVVVRCDP